MFMSLGILGSQASAENFYFVGRVSPQNASLSGVPVAVRLDDAGYIYLLTRQVYGNPDIPGDLTTTGVLIKINPTGQIVWQRKLGNTASTDVYDLVIDSRNPEAGNLYVLSDSVFTGPGSFVTKYSNNGEFQWSRNVEVETVVGIAATATGVIVVNRLGNYIVLDETDGTTQFSKTFSGDPSAPNMKVISRDKRSGSNDMLFAYGGTSPFGSIKSLGFTLGPEQDNEVGLMYYSDSTNDAKDIDEAGSQAYVYMQDVLIAQQYRFPKADPGNPGNRHRILNSQGDKPNGTAGISTDDTRIFYTMESNSIAYLTSGFGSFEYQRELVNGRADSIGGIDSNVNCETVVVVLRDKLREGTIIYKFPHDGSITGTVTLDGESYGMVNATEITLASGLGTEALTSTLTNSQSYTNNTGYPNGGGANLSYTFQEV